MSDPKDRLSIINQASYHRALTDEEFTWMVNRIRSLEYALDHVVGMQNYDQDGIDLAVFLAKSALLDD